MRLAVPLAFLLSMAPAIARADAPVTPVTPAAPAAPATPPAPGVAPSDALPPQPVIPADNPAVTPTVPTPRQAAAKREEPVTKELNPYVPWYRGEYGNNRIFHLSLTAGLTLAYVATETLFKSTFAADHCRWCNPGAVDNSVRNTVVWKNRDRANFLGSLDAYVVAPAVGFGLLIASDHKASWSRIIDDVVPVAETIVVSELLTQVVKFTVGRSRPYAHYGDAMTKVTTDDNASFISGHSVLGFAITASAGLVCHHRHYWTEPYVWGIGIALSLSTEYLRMAADKHYLTDVLAGGAFGLATGLLVPRLMFRDIKIVPVSNGDAKGAALVGTF